MRTGFLGAKWVGDGGKSNFFSCGKMTGPKQDEKEENEFGFRTLWKGGGLLMNMSFGAKLRSGNNVLEG